MADRGGASASLMRVPSGPTPAEKPRREPQSSRAPPPPPPGNTGTHWTSPGEYLLASARRANILTARRHPLDATGSALGVALQRYVHHDGGRPPVRQVLLHLRLLALYPPLPEILPELVTLLEWENAHVCRLAHYHVRQAAPVDDVGAYREVIDALQREVRRPSPARRAAAVKTMGKVFVAGDFERAIDFVGGVFRGIGGARVEDPSTVVLKKKGAKDEDGTGGAGTKEGLGKRIMKKPAIFGGGSALRPGVNSAPDEDHDEILNATGEGAAVGKKSRFGRGGADFDDGAGGEIEGSVGPSAMFIKTRFGKMVVGHAVFAALRRINRVAGDSCRVEAYFFDSGLVSAVPSTVRHAVALLEIRASRSPVQVSKYISSRLPHKNPPSHKKLLLEDLGAKVYFARLLGALAEDPNLAQHAPDSAPQKPRDRKAKKAEARAQAVAGENVKEKAGNLFKFLFNRERVDEVSSAMRATSSALVVRATGALALGRRPEDPRGVELAEALVNLLKNSSNRVLLEALRGLSNRRWTTWFEAPIPQGALYNSPELIDPASADLDGGGNGGWGIDDDDDDDDDDGDDVGSYEDDIADAADESAVDTSPTSKKEELDPDILEKEAKGKTTFVSRASERRREKFEARSKSAAPFYLRKLGAGMVPALEVVLRRVYHAMLHDDPIRRFAAADTVIVLARSKMYGHTAVEHDRLQRAKAAASQNESLFARRAGASASRGTVATSNTPSFSGSGLQGAGGDHPFDPLVGSLKELMDGDRNQYVSGRAAIALAFVIASGAGRQADSITIDDLEDDDFANSLSSTLLIRFFGLFVTRDGAGRGVSFRLVSDVMDYIIFELLDLSPELGPSAVELVELWAVTHPTIGVCGRLGSLWEKVLSIGQGAVVGASIFRAMAVKPHAERVASAAAAFLRRRTLDLAVLTVGAQHMTGIGVPEPLPRAVSIEVEKYFSLLWHSALLGPSAECRTLSVEALGGAAALAGDPLRVCTYERLGELVRVKGLGLKISAENVLDALDVLYFCRERFSEARHENHIARDGTNRSMAWLQIVWRLAAEASSAAQVLLGVAPPTGWLALGPGAAADVANAEARFGDVRDRQNTEKLLDSSVAQKAPPVETPVLAIQDADDASDLMGEQKMGSPSGLYAYAPKNFERTSVPPSDGNEDYDQGRARRRRSRYSEEEGEVDRHDDYSRYERRRSSRSPSPPRQGASASRRGDRYDYESDDDRGEGRPRRSSHGAEEEMVEFGDGEESRRNNRMRMGALRGSLEKGGRRMRDGVEEGGRRMRDGVEEGGRQARELTDRKQQEASDRELAKLLQKEEKGGRRLFGDDKRLGAAAAAVAYAPGNAAKLLKNSFKGSSSKN